MFRFLWCPCPKRVPGRWELGQYHLPDGKTHLLRTPNFPPFFAKQHFHPFSLIAWCQGAYFYKLILFSPSFLALETGPVLPARMAELTRAGEQAAVWQRPGPARVYQRKSRRGASLFFPLGRNPGSAGTRKPGGSATLRNHLEHPRVTGGWRGRSFFSL